MQVIALAAKKEYTGEDVFGPQDENNLTLLGYIAFLDPPKKEVKTVLKEITKAKVQIKILTGDNPDATRAVCKEGGLNADEILTGNEIDNMSDEILSKKLKQLMSLLDLHHFKRKNC